MNVIDLNRTLVGELQDVLSALYGGGFSDRLTDRVVRRLVSPKRLRLCKRLSYLIAYLVRSEIDALNFLYAENLSSYRLLNTLQVAAVRSHRLEATEAGIRLAQSDGSTFDISRSHLIELVCTAHAIGEWLGPETLHDLIDEIAVAPDQTKTIDSAAAGLASAFDRYRQRRIGSSTARMKRKAALEFLSNTHPGDVYDSTDVESDTVREFWMSHSDIRDLDVKTYLGVHALFEILIEVLDDHLEVEFSGELESSQSISNAGDQEDWLALRQEAGRMKFLFPKQIERSALFTDAKPSAWRLRESAAWGACWGPVQTRLREEMNEAAYNGAWEAARAWDFPVQTLSALSQKLREATLAVLHILIFGQKSGALALAYLFEPAAVGAKLLDDIDPVQLNEDDILELQDKQFRRLCESTDASLVLLRKQAEKAWKNIRRDGFRAEDLEDSAFLDHIDLLSSRFIGALRFVERLDAQWQESQPTQSDMQNVQGMFDRTFKNIYRPVLGEKGS